MENGEPLVLDDFPYPSEITGQGIRWSDNRAVKVEDGLSFTWRDVSDRVETRHRLARQALQDPLTGLPNRQRLDDALVETLGRTPRTGDHVAVLYCALDGLKTYNDLLGHEAGDHVLRAVADRPSGAIRAGDLVARIGGDEFAVVASAIHDAAAADLAAKIVHAVTRPLVVAGEQILPTLSIGVAMADHGHDPTDALRRADLALYREKKPGREAGERRKTPPT